MAPPSDKTSDLERRVSARTSARISLDAVDEDHDLALGGLVSDGFRPRGMSTPSLTSGSSTLVPDDSPASSSRTDRPTTTPKIQMALRSSSPHDGPTKLARRATNSTESTQSTIYYPRDGPYQGPSAPSHPYQMYPQNVRPARTMSTVTSSTVPPSESSYNGPRGPSHPYALYPQADSAGVELDADAVRPDAIPLGFHGLPDQYRRRAGPDGDDIGDIIGPDGHTEQLPPYTRYPDEAYARKAAAMDGTIDPAPGGASIVPPIQTAPASAVLTIPGAGGIGLATRNPEFESTDDLGSPRSRHSTRSFASDDSQRRINMDEGVSEKGSPPKKWQLWMRRKLCGVVPYWALCLTGVVLVIMAIVLGAAIGVFLGRQKKPPPGHRDGTWEPTFDTWPTTAPPDLQPLPTGTYSVPLMAVSTSSNTCFLDPSMSQAWNCLVSSGLQMTISKDDHDYLALLNSNHSYTLASYVYSYGEQPPTIPRPVPLELVSDRSEPNRGPAWYKMLSYNKTVILPEGWLSVPNSQRRARHLDPPIDGISAFKRKGIAQPGEKPWFHLRPAEYYLAKLAEYMVVLIINRIVVHDDGNIIINNNNNNAGERASRSQPNTAMVD
ncbi:c2fbb224-f5f0-483a-b1bc-e245fbda6f6d [Thermothielavioides terrestris]|uniref:C2fbb224-f5f0-483a-b1bc-e245fbda6f6d n=1 Tax=Thermothielavioides terrestris TaxID=2587410 RepID=A0A446BX24_9PEZI|nr:c2fbb224-f5f0-483a-b1bc-e245fbda6f6d [Thermothielavioides terrestris]